MDGPSSHHRVLSELAEIIGLGTAVAWQNTMAGDFSHGLQMSNPPLLNILREHRKMLAIISALWKMSAPYGKFKTNIAMSQICEPKAAEFGRHISQGSFFISKVEDIEREDVLLPYAHYLRQAWDEFGLSGVLCVDNRPTIYLCEADRFTTEQKRNKQRLVWNQGLVPLLIFVTPNQIEVHSAVKKPEEKKTDDLPSLVKDLGKITDALEYARFVRSIETGQFFHDQRDFFPANETVDRCLVQNLVHTALKLKNAGWKLPQAYALLGRVLFVSFLEEREFIKPDYYPAGTNCLLDILSKPIVADAKQLLYREFFQKLKREFNGTMFDTALAEEERQAGKTELQILANFLNGQDMKTGQMTLDFWAYDFRYIPVETISAIYEEFMGNTDLKKKHQEGAYYTPRHLADTTLHVALENHYSRTADWRVLDASCGSGIFLVAMFNLLAEQWRRENSTSHKKTKAQALLDILQNQIRGVDVNLDACRIAAFSLYLALFEKLQPMDVDEFKKNVRAENFLPPLLWDGKGQEPGNPPVVIRGDFLKDKLPLENNFDLVIGNPPWESRGKKQIALDFAKKLPNFLRKGGIGCLLLPSTILVNRHGTLDGDWFRNVSVEKIVQLADFRFVLFEATHPCFIMRWRKTKPTSENIVAYETPKLNRFDRRSGVIVIEPDDQKLVPQHDIIEAALCNKLQAAWSRKFWGTPRDEAFLRRLDFYPPLSKAVAKKKWKGGVGFKPYYPKASQGDPVPIKPWKLSDKYLSGDRGFPQLVVQESDFSTLKQCLEASEHRKLKIKASLDYLHRKPTDEVFSPPMVVFSQGFTKFAFCNYKFRFQNVLRSITGTEQDADLLRFLTAVLGSRLVQYQAFHSGSSNGIGRDQLQIYESLALPFPLPDHELATPDAEKIVNEAASILKEVECSGKNVLFAKRAEFVKAAKSKLEPLVEAYFSVTDAERILIEDTLKLSQPSIHKKNIDGKIPSLAFPELADRKCYAHTLCDVLNRRARKEGIHISAQGTASKTMNLVLFTVLFGDGKKPYADVGGDAELWTALKKVNDAAQRENGNFNYLRGFSYFQRDRLYILKPATMRNWCRTAALNDADAIFEHLNK